MDAKTATMSVLLLAACVARGGDGEESASAFDAGADLRIRQEFMDNVPGLPGGGLLQRAPSGPYRTHQRYRVRAWASFAPSDTWTLYARAADEFRWNIRPRNHKTTFPDEAIIENLYLDAKGLFDGFLDFRIGRQDIYNLYGLDHVFVDGTPGDGSRTVYSDMARASMDFGEAGRLDVFALYNFDDNPLRWGTVRGDHRALSGLGGAEPDMDDWGYGAIWSGEACESLPYQVFALQKRTASYRRGGEKRPTTRRETLGAKVEPRLDDEFSLQLEAMGQTGRTGDGGWIGAWSSYAGLNWKKKAAPGSAAPFASAGFHFMSGDKDAAKEDGGHHAWDPIWSRGVNDSEIFLYGTHYGAAWWSNMMFANLKGGISFSPLHRVSFAAGPMFAETDDGLGGGDGHFKGFLSQARYDFPLLVRGEDEGRGLEIFGHIYAELFNPGDYFETDRPSWFIRWQLDFRF